MSEGRSVGYCPWCGQQLFSQKTGAGKTIYAHNSNGEDCSFILYEKTYIRGNEVMLSEGMVRDILEFRPILVRNIQSKKDPSKFYDAQFVLKKEPGIWNDRFQMDWDVIFPEKESLGACPWCSKDIVEISYIDKNTGESRRFYSHRERGDCDFCLGDKSWIFGQEYWMNENLVRGLLSKPGVWIKHKKKDSDEEYRLKVGLSQKPYEKDGKRYPAYEKRND